MHVKAHISSFVLEKIDAVPLKNNLKKKKFKIWKHFFTPIFGRKKSNLLSESSL